MQCRLPYCTSTDKKDLLGKKEPMVVYIVVAAFYTKSFGFGMSCKKKQKKTRGNKNH